MHTIEPTELIPGLRIPGGKRATFLHERAEPAPDAPLAPAERLDPWLRGMLADEALMDERLAGAGFTRDGLLRMLEAEELELAPGADDALAWTGFLDGVRTGRFAAEPVPRFRRGEDEEAEPYPFRGFIHPFLQFALARLRPRLAELGTDGEPAVTPDVEAQLVLSLIDRLLTACTPTLTLELNVARLLEQLPGDTPEARFHHFSVRHFQDTDRLLALLDEYAVLGRLMVTTAQRWADNLVELLQRLRADRPLLARRFCGGRDPGAVRAVRLGVSDAHRGGRGVAFVHFSSGLRVVYKPTSLAVDRRFHTLLRAVNHAGARHPHRVLRVADRGDYGWIEYVAAAPCDSEDGLRRYHWRQGSQIALLYLLRAVDFHFENLIAAGEHPVLVDLEALFHHEPPGAEPRTAFARAEADLRESVLRIGLLPLLHRDRDGRVGPDISGIGGRGGQVFSSAVPQLAGTNTDEMRMVRGEGRTQEAHNRPSLRGDAVEGAAFAEEIVAGFEETLALALRHRDRLRTFVDGFAGLPVRHILRMTRHYALLLREGWHPDDLRDGLDRERLLDHLWAEVSVRPSLRRVVPSELEDLRLGDVPVFTARPGARDLWDSAGRRFPDYFARSSLGDAQQRLDTLEGDEPSRQARFIRMALSAVAPESAGGRPAPAVVPAGTPEQAFLDGAARIGDHLLELAVRGDDDACWIGLDVESGDAAGHRRQRVLAPTGLSLYAGTPGIALFLAHLGARTGEARFTEAARAGLNGARAQLREPGTPGSASPGVFLGRGSLLYLRSHLAELWNEPALLDEALADLPQLEETIARDEALDILGGAAGTAVVLLDLYRRTGDPRARRAAHACGERLLATARPTGAGLGWPTTASAEPLPGFSHGAAGIAWALARLGAELGDDRFGAAARQALAFERGVFDPASGHWNHAQITWCHGPLSVALGRLLSLDLADDPRARGEIAAAGEAAVRFGALDDVCLCHGTLGNADLLQTAAAALHRPEWHRAAQSWGLQALGAVGALGRPGPLPKWARSPGLMCGLAGAGYGLLRLADPARVPSVLALAPAPAAALS